MSELLLKEAKLTQYNLEFCGMGILLIVLHTDADVARASCHKRGVGRMKHLAVRHFGLKEELQNGNYSVKRVDRKFNASDMLTHSPSAEELRKFLPFSCVSILCAESACNSSSHLLRFQCYPAVDATFVT